MSIMVIILPYLVKVFRKDLKSNRVIRHESILAAVRRLTRVRLRDMDLRFLLFFDKMKPIGCEN